VRRGLFRPQQWSIAALLFFMILLNYLDRAVLSVVSPLMRREMGLSPADYALALNAFLAAYAIMYLGSGVIMDRTGSRLGLALFVAFWSAACGLHAFSTGLGSLMLFRFLLGLAEPGGWTGAVKTVSERYPASQRGLASGIFTAGAGVGALIAPPAVTFLMLRYGWRTAFWVTAAAGLLWIPCWLRATRGASAAPVPPKHNTLRQVALVLRDRRALAFAAARFLADTTGYFFLFWLPEYLVSSKQFSLVAVGALAWIPFCCQDIGSILGGYASGSLVHRGIAAVTARKVIMTAAALFVALGSALHGLSAAMWVIAAVSLCTFGVGAWSANLHAVPTDIFPGDRVATVHGLGGSAGAVGGILFNWLVGALSTTGNYGMVFVVLAALQPLGVAALWLWAREDKSLPAA